MRTKKVFRFAGAAGLCLVLISVAANPKPGFSVMAPLQGLKGMVRQGWNWMAWGNPPASVKTIDPPVQPEELELGVTGTPIFSGFLRDLGEYNSKLVGLAGYRVYEEMRRGDAQVAATLMAMKRAIQGAEWTVRPPDDASSQEMEATKFIEENLMERIDFQSMIENSLLMIDFGAAVHEDVYEIDGDQICLKKLAPRLPLTFWRWITEADGETLLALEQYGYRGSQFVITQVPANKLSLFTFQQEGANFAGRSLLRAMYQHWYIKNQLYKIDAIAQERNGIGVPTIEMAPNATAEDRTAALKWIQQLTAHEKAGLLLPPGWKFTLTGVTGQTRDAKESIQHHNTQISMAGLTQFMMLGQGSGRSGGNRSLGETQADFFYLGMQATADKIGRAITMTTVKRLVAFNFGDKIRPPKFIPQKLAGIRFESIVDALFKLANQQVDAVRPDDDMRAWIRQQIGAPKEDPTSARVPVQPTAYSLPPKPGEPANNGPQDGRGKAAPGAGDGNAPGNGSRAAGTPQKPGAPGKPTRVRASDSRFVVDGVPMSRLPQGPEKFVAFSEIVSKLDSGRDAVAASLRQARPRIQAEIIHKLVAAPVRTMHRASVAPDEKLLAEIENALTGVYQFGSDQVTAERARQRAGKGPGDAQTIRAADTKSKDPVGLYADGAVTEFTNNLTARAANVVKDLKVKQNLTTGEVIQQAGQDLDEQSDKWIDSVGSKAANNAFADGRSDGYEQYKDEIDRVLYSALLDLNTCDACEAADGEEGATEDDVPDVPNPDCDGGDRCRCVHVYVFADEAAA